MDQAMGLLLSFALHDFSISGIFTSLRTTKGAELDEKISEFDARLGVIRRPGAIAILWNLLPRVTTDDPSMRYGILRLFERLLNLNHRNQAILSSLGLVKSLFGRFYDTRNGATVSEQERHVLQKLLKGLLEMGATTSEARTIFQKATKEDETLDTDVLEFIRSGMKSRWLEHFSMESPAALVVSEEGIKGMPITGFTFMVSLCASDLFFGYHFVILDVVMDRNPADQRTPSTFLGSSFFSIYTDTEPSA
jgi:hypothetical protein